MATEKDEADWIVIITMIMVAITIYGLGRL